MNLGIILATPLAVIDTATTGQCQQQGMTSSMMSLHLFTIRKVSCSVSTLSHHLSVQALETKDRELARQLLEQEYEAEGGALIDCGCCYTGYIFEEVCVWQALSSAMIDC